jgi:RNA polymerase sigma-70 factor (ECF subfamily)
MFVCAHPSIDPTVRSALMLQVVLGLDAAQIARGFIIPAETMTKRLVRAKAKIRTAGIRFEEPERRELPSRIGAVLEAIYAAYTLDWDRSESHRGTSLCAEAWFLADLVAGLLKDNAEAMGLLTLIELCEARKPAAMNNGERVPLHEQDPQAWDTGLIRRAAKRLAAASRLAMTGPYQIEAAIQMAHCSRQQTGSTPWGDIRALYEGLLSLQPTTGAVLGYALACAYASGEPAEGLAVLDSVDPGLSTRHQPWWAARAHLLDLAGRAQEARTAYDQAIALAQSEDTRRALERRRASLFKR